MLYVPADRPAFVAGAAGRGADAVILDLEDGVGDPQRARRAIPDARVAVGAGGADVLVRVDADRAAVDTDLALTAGVEGLVLPKVSSVEEVRVVTDRIASVADQGPGLVLLIESARALRRLDDLLAAAPGIVAAGLGPHDLAHDLGVAPDSELMTHAHGALVVAAKAAGVAPFGLLTTPGFTDLEAYAEAVARARAFGYVGAMAVHPAQVPLLNVGFAPTEAELDEASRVVAAYDTAAADGRGAVAVDGRMVDRPVAERARGLLGRGRVDG